MLDVTKEDVGTKGLLDVKAPDYYNAEQATASLLMLRVVNGISQ